jgi:protein tyrosine phosphatase
LFFQSRYQFQFVQIFLQILFRAPELHGHFGMAYSVTNPQDHVNIFPMGVNNSNLETQPKPVFVHCRSGRNRTGVMIAAYRVFNGMSNEDAIADCKTRQAQP